MAKLTRVIDGYLTPKGNFVSKQQSGMWVITDPDNGDYIDFHTLKEVREWCDKTNEDIRRYE